MTRGSLMVCGTASDAGKTVVVTGLCRWLARQGHRVAPFKAQNMALNSYVTGEGGEIGRAQASQAMAAGVEPEVAMNPILLKPTGESECQVVVMGRPTEVVDALTYQSAKLQYLGTVLEAFDSLRARFDVVVCEGAGSPAEINLSAHDIVNLGFAAERDIPAILIGDIERGGVFAAFYGTVVLQPPERRPLLRGLVINKFRGDPSLLVPGIEQIEKLCGVGYLGTIPHSEGLGLDAEDSLQLLRWGRESPASRANGEVLDIAVIGLPHISNFTDFDPLAAEPNVAVRLTVHANELGTPDLVIVPGTKATVADLEWMRSTGMLEALRSAHREGSIVLGICGGFQMLGRTIEDPVESAAGDVEGIGMLDVHTVFEQEKITVRRKGNAARWCLGSPPISGYEIHHGRTKVGSSCLSFALLDGANGTEEEEGAVAVNRRAIGTSLHGLFEEDDFRAAFLFAVAEVRRKCFHASGVSFRALRNAQFDRCANLVADHLDTGRIMQIIESER